MFKETESKKKNILSCDSDLKIFINDLFRFILQIQIKLIGGLFVEKKTLLESQCQ